MRKRARTNNQANEEVEKVLKFLFRTAWVYRFELLVAGVLGGLWWYTDQRYGPVVATAVAAYPPLLVMAIGPSRRFVVRLERNMELRRAWSRACINSGVTGAENSPSAWGPRVSRIRKTASGDHLELKLTSDCTAADIEKKVEQLSASLRAVDVRVTRHKTKDRAHVVLIRQDPFDDPRPLQWPMTNAGQFSVWDDIPVARDEEGELVSVNLVEHNLLIGGEPGAGKSVALSLFCAAVCMDPNTKLWLLDGKRVELAAWGPLAEQAVGPDGTAAVALLRELREEMERRYVELLAKGRRKVHPDDDMPLHVVVCDELAFYLHAPAKKVKDEMAELLRDLIARGRAAGIIVIAATQKPDHQTVPTNVRDLISFRWALRCTTPQASDTILGQGWASTGADASSVPVGQRGVGYLLAEGERPNRVRAFYLSDDDIEKIASRCIDKQADRELVSMVK